MTDSIGGRAEQLVRDALAADGWRILGANVRVGRDELDLVARDPGPPAALVVVEVRWRNRRDFGLPEETLDHRKRRALRRGLAGLVGAGVLPDGSLLPHEPLRVDLVVVEPGDRIRHHRGIAL